MNLYPLTNQRNLVIWMAVAVHLCWGIVVIFGVLYGPNFDSFRIVKPPYWNLLNYLTPVQSVALFFTGATLAVISMWQTNKIPHLVLLLPQQTIMWFLIGIQHLEFWQASGSLLVALTILPVSAFLTIAHMIRCIAIARGRI